MNCLRKKMALAIVLALALGLLAQVGEQGRLGAAGKKPDPAALLAQADDLIRGDIRDSNTRTEAFFLYEDVLEIAAGDGALSRHYRAGAQMGLGLINLFDLLDLLPALTTFLGFDLTDLFDLLPFGLSAAGPPPAFHPAQTCTPLDFEDYLWFMDSLLSNMLLPISEHFRLARELDPAVTKIITDAQVTLIPDDPATPEDETAVLDLSGEWDATDMALLQGGLDLLVGGIKLLTSYDGPLQGVVNSTFTPDCTPRSGSEEWTALFGPYGLLVSGGEERMNQAEALFVRGFAGLADGLNGLAWETDDQTDDITRYKDIGKDGLAAGDTAYPGPDADGSEGNRQYDPGEPWGMESAEALISGLLGGVFGGVPLDLEEMSRLLPLPVLAEVMEAMGRSAESRTPVDLIPTLIKPLLANFGLNFKDQELYALGLPAFNLGALFLPPLADFSVFEGLKDANGVVFTEPETATGDTSHTWPDGSGRVDPSNGTVDPLYSFFQDLDAGGNPVGVLGGLISLPITEPEDFDTDGNLIGEVEYQPMMNPQFNALLTALGGLLGP